jgi:hypothetical protein
LAEPVYGAVGGAKIATTTKVMQRLMGIMHPQRSNICAHDPYLAGSPENR